MTLSRPITTERAADRGQSICVVVQGLFERSDSIGYDAVAQVGLIKAMMPGTAVRLFAERFEPGLHPGVEIEPIERLLSGAGRLGEAILVYHYCDGWARFDAYLPVHRGPVHVRWHNNTPPWFYIDASPRAVARTVSGFERIVDFIETLDCGFWVNSIYTGRQLLALGCDEARIRIVYPASRYLFGPIPSQDGAGRVPEGALRLLFVGRVVAHKGHRHLIDLADYIQINTGRPVVLECAGRHEESAGKFNDELEALADRSVATVRFRGELGGEALDALYAECHALVCLSEHEGFGLPVFEAMRCGLPVVAWAHTALAELLVEHPLAFADFDLRLFAAAISLLDDPEFRRQVIETQFNILRGYNVSRLQTQIEASLGLHAPREDEWAEPAPSGPPRDRAILRSLLDGKQSLRAVETAPPRRSPYDAGDNFVTLHDLNFYRRYVENSAAALAGAAASGEQGEYPPFAWVSPEAFATQGGHNTEAGLTFDCSQPIPTRLVYGPYLNRPPGLYEARLDLVFGPTPARSTVLFIDVYADSQGEVFAWRRVVIPRSEGEVRIQVQLLFRLIKTVDDLEFRVQTRRSGPRRGRFTGLGLRRRIGLDWDAIRVAMVMAVRLATPRVKAGGRIARLFKWWRHRDRRA